MTGPYAVRTGNGSILIETPIYSLKQWEVAAYGVHVPPLNHNVKLEITHINIDTKRLFCHFQVSKK
jgi:hypothetical protein